MPGLKHCLSVPCRFCYSPQNDKKYICTRGYQDYELDEGETCPACELLEENRKDKKERLKIIKQLSK